MGRDYRSDQATVMSAAARLAVVLALAFALTAPSFGSTDDGSADFGDRIDVTAVTLAVDVRGATGGVPSDLVTSDFEVLEDGVAQAVLEVVGAERADTEAQARSDSSVTEGEGSWEVVIYLDQVLSARRSIRTAAEALMGQAEALTRMGSVRIMAANSSIEEILPPSRDPVVVRDALEHVAKKVRGHEEILVLRRQVLRDVDQSEEIDRFKNSARPRGINPTPQGAPASVVRDQNAAAGSYERDARRRLLVSSAVNQEAQLIRRQSVLLTRWARSRRAFAPRALFLVCDGFDVDPRDFYLPLVPQNVQSELNSKMQELNVGPLRQDVTRQLGASGWIVLPIALGGLQNVSASSLTTSGSSSLRTQIGERAAGAQLRSSFLLPHGLEPLLAHADETGGELLTDEGQLDRVVGELGQRILLTYQAARPPDGKIHRVEVVPRRPEIEVRSTRWVASETLEAISESRADGVIAGDGAAGDLPLESVVLLQDAPEGSESRRGTLAARIRLEPLRQLRRDFSATALRVTLAVYFRDRPPFLRHEVLSRQDLSRGDHWDYTASLALPLDTSNVVVVVEELTSGSWGAGLAPLVRRSSS